MYISQVSCAPPLTAVPFSFFSAPFPACKKKRLELIHTFHHLEIPTAFNVQHTTSPTVLPTMPHRHDIYDDTAYAQPRSADRRHGHSTRDRGSRDRRHDAPPPSHAYQPPAHYPQPPQDVTPHPQDTPHSTMQRDMDRALSSAERDMAAMFGTGASIFGGILSSVDRLFDDMTTGFASTDANGRQKGSYFYESRTTTVGPDGRVREETVRTTPGQDGKPQTHRDVREGDQATWNSTRLPGEHLWHGQPPLGYPGGHPYPYANTNPHAHPHQGYAHGHGHGHGYARRQPAEPDVIVEELDENGNVVNSNVPPGARGAPLLEDRRTAEQRHREQRHREQRHSEQRHSEQRHGGHPREDEQRGSWFQERYKQWRSNRA